MGVVEMVEPNGGSPGVDVSRQSTLPPMIRIQVTMASSFRSRNSSYNVHVTERVAAYSSSDDESSEDEDRRIQREEDALESALSDRHGEAAEAKEKRPRTEEEIAAEYAKPKRQKRPQLTISALTGVNGLARLQHELKAIPAPHKSVASAAAYSLAVTETLKSFCYNLMPSMAFEDVLLKIEQLSSKKELKVYLHAMQLQVRNDYVEKLYGKEKAERMIQELEDGLKQQEMAWDETVATTETTAPEIQQDSPTGSPLPQRHPTADHADKTESLTDNQNKENRDLDDPTLNTHQDDEAVLAMMEQASQAKPSQRRRVILDDDESEAEADFIDIMGGSVSKDKEEDIASTKSDEDAQDDNDDDKDDRANADDPESPAQSPPDTIDTTDKLAESTSVLEQESPVSLSVDGPSVADPQGTEDQSTWRQLSVNSPKDTATIVPTLTAGSLDEIASIEEGERALTCDGEDD